MSVNYSVAVRIAMLDAIETAIGSAPLLRFYTGAKSTRCMDAAPSGQIASFSMTGDFMAAATESSTNVVTKLKNGASTWSGTNTGGTIASYRIYDSTGTVCHEQGTVTTTAVGTGDILLDAVVVTAGQTITITGKTITAGNA